jgi:TetR/AcrR family transcriptional regulator, fatty acid metabolism regulator protein
MKEQHMAAGKKVNLRKKQANETKGRIYETAVKMMQEHGFEKITVEEICKEAGVAVGSFYYHFQSKNDILTEIFHRADEYFVAHKSDITKEKDASTQIAEFFRRYAAYTASTDIEFTKHLYNTNNKYFLTKDREMYQLLRSLIENGQNHKTITDTLTVDEIVNYLFVAARGLVFDWCLHDGEYDLENAADMYFVRLIPVLLN